jgi:hypothetical protein
MNLINRNRLFLSVILFIVAYILLWPLYQYVFDVDSIGYAAVARHYLNGDLEKAVNGFWNPLHSWLVVPFIKMGLKDWVAFKVTNAIFATGTLYSLHLLLNKFSLETFIKSCIQYVSVIILLHYCFFELTADVLFVLLMLLYYNLVKSAGFFSSTKKNLMAGVVGGLLYLDKSYGFPFFLFNHIVIHLFLNPDKKQIIKQILTGFASFFLLAFPWIYALHWKYGEWMIAFGKYNAHWDFNNVPNNQPLFEPPPYEGSAGVWEDPWHVQKDNLQSASFKAVLMQQVKTMLFNFQQWLLCLNEISFLAPAVLFISAVYGFFQKNKVWAFFAIAVLTLSSGYFLLHFETRFLWPLAFIFMIAAAILLHQLLKTASYSLWQKNMVWLVVWGSFLLEPINQLKDRAGAGKETYKLVEEMEAKNIKGKFTSNGFNSRCQVMAHWSHSMYYSITQKYPAYEELETEMKKYKIRYYFFFYKSNFEKEIFLNSPVATKAVKLHNLSNELIVAEINN